MVAMMSVWMWATAGVVAAVGFSAVVGLALGAILGRIGQEVGQMLETEPWTLAPSLRVKTHVQQR